MDVEEQAKLIGAYANTCCERSDGYETDVAAHAEVHLRAAVAVERSRCVQLVWAAHSFIGIDYADQIVKSILGGK